jgi:sulfate adenylyltransferase subunit 1 (EFTu-like GTPase family)
MDINSLRRLEDDKQINMNDIGKVVLRTTIALNTDKYYRNRSTGSFVLVDEGTNETVAAGMMA